MQKNGQPCLPEASGPTLTSGSRTFALMGGGGGSPGASQFLGGEGGLEEGSFDRGHYFHWLQGRQKENCVNDGLCKKGYACMSTTCCYVWFLRGFLH